MLDLTVPNSPLDEDSSSDSTTGTVGKLLVKPQSIDDDTKVLNLSISYESNSPVSISLAKFLRNHKDLGFLE